MNNHELAIYLDADGDVCLTYWDWKHGRDLFFVLKEEADYEMVYDVRIADMIPQPINLRDTLKDLIHRLDTEASR